MTTDFEQQLAAIDQATLKPLICNLLHETDVGVVSWHNQPVDGGFGHAYGVYRFQGEAQVEDETCSWSLILKVVGPDSGGREPSAWNYWKREALVYQSGLLETLPGDLVAPRCLAVVEAPDQTHWLWLEEVVEDGPELWPLERYSLAARHLGQFNGPYLVGTPMPNVPWLSVSRLPELLDRAKSGIDELPALSRNPLFEQLLPGDSLVRFQRIWAERERLTALLERLPYTLCHHDAFRRNLMARVGPSGRQQTVAIDWAELGRGVIGEELVALFTGTLKFVPVEIGRISDLDKRIFEGYLTGLQDAGWQGDPRMARFGYAATAALGIIADHAIKWPAIAKRAAALPPDTEPPRLLSPGGYEQAAALNLNLIKLGEEAVDLVDVLA
jgi:hypothetical protein